MTMKQLISDVEVQNNTVRVFANKAFGQKYLRADFKAIYHIGSNNKLKVDDSIAIIPFILNVAPIIWLSGEKVEVPILDQDFYKSLEKIKEVFSKMYPSLKWTGAISAKRLVKRKPSDHYVTSILFSGGVDSVYSVINNNQAKNKQLITILGSDIARSNKRGWATVKGNTQHFAKLNDAKDIYIDSNFREFLNIPLLERLWPEITDGWWAGVQHGVGIIGLTAPVTEKGKVVIAATHNSGYQQVWGSNPMLDSAVKWGAVGIIHDGYDKSRQQKIQFIIDTKNSGKDKPQLRVCYSNSYGDGKNCCRCEKCLRTFAGIVLGGARPLDYGFNLTVKDGLRHIKSKYRLGLIYLGQDELFMWNDLKSSAEKVFKNVEITEDQRLMSAWLIGFDFDLYYKLTKPILQIRKKTIRVIRSSPAVNKVIKRGQALLKRQPRF